MQNSSRVCSSLCYLSFRVLVARCPSLFLALLCRIQTLLFVHFLSWNIASLKRNFSLGETFLAGGIGEWALLCHMAQLKSFQWCWKAQTEDFRGAVGRTGGFVTINPKENQNLNLGMSSSKTSAFHNTMILQRKNTISKASKRVSLRITSVSWCFRKGGCPGMKPYFYVVFPSTAVNNLATLSGSSPSPK